MSHAARSTRRAAALAVAALLGAGLAAAAAGPPAAAAPAKAPAPVRACPAAPAAGHATCLASFRTVAGARLAGVPAGAAVRAAAAQSERTGAVAPPSEGYGPADIKRIYALPTSRPGQTVAIVDAFDNPNAAHDLTAFRSAYGLPACTVASGCFRKVNQTGGADLPPGNSGWGVEIALDLQAVSAACPNCKILLVEANNPSSYNLGRSVDTAVRLGARIVSNSYGGFEYNGVHGLDRKFYDHPGRAIVASSGDDGFGDASFPASSRHVVAVGGTSVTPSRSGYRTTAWYGAGSGCSAWFEKPSWQTDTHCPMRTVSDVSALADPDTGFAVYDTYKLAVFGVKPGWIVVGGTSLAAPLISGMIALAGNPRDLDSAAYIYRHTSGLHDVVGGNNSGFADCGGDYLCNGVKGYDGPTGVGTPVGVSAL